MWFVSLGFLAILALVTAWRSGPHLAVGVTVLVALLFPKWLILDVGGMPLDVRVASAIAALAVYCLHPRAVFRTSLIALDYVMIGMLIVHSLSDIWNAGFQWGLPVRLYGEWAVPYFAGRVATMQWEHVRKLTPYAIGVVLLLVVFAGCESFWKWNIYEHLFGVAETDGPPRNLTRWGLNRAFGPTKNPIYLSTLLLLLAPWSVFAAVLAYRNDGPKFWLGMPVVTIAGILFSGSRAPLLALLPFAYTMAVVQLKRWRLILVPVGVIAAALLAFNARYVLELLNSWGEKAPPLTHKIIVGEAEVDYSGTLHRLYLWDVYAIPMRRAGWLGFGTDRTAIFPPQVPMGPEHTSALRRLWCVDNAYVLMILRFGYVGVTVLILAGLSAVHAYWRLADQASLRRQTYAAAMCGAIVATLCVLFTVWMPHDFGFLFIWTIAAGAGLLTNSERQLHEFD